MLLLREGFTATAPGGTVVDDWIVVVVVVVAVAVVGVAVVVVMPTVGRTTGTEVVAATSDVGTLGALIAPGWGSTKAEF